VRGQVGHIPLVNPIERDAVGGELERLLGRDAREMGNLSSRKTPPELVVAVCVLGTTAYLLAQAQRREDICAALFRFEQKYSVSFPTSGFVDDFQNLRRGCGSSAGSIATTARR
jgi:hypothetical protein